MGNSPSPPSSLCTTCSSIGPDLQRLIIRGDPDRISPSILAESRKETLILLRDTIIILDTSQHILSRRWTCRLCGLIAETLDGLSDPGAGCCFLRSRVPFASKLEEWHYGLDNPTSHLQVVHTYQDADGLEAARVALTQRDLWDADAPFPPSKSNFIYNELTTLLELQPAVNSIPSTLARMDHVAIVARKQAGVGDPRLTARFVNPSCVDFELVRRWMHHYLCNHPTCHDAYKIREPPSEHFFLIDTQKLCVRLAPSDPFTNETLDNVYVALSYCWGLATSGDSLRHTKENSAFLETEGSLASHVVPRTIRDAMLFTKKLGFRYLWVDALCIVQDDDAIKSKQINKMDAVYSCAVLTIIAASSPSSDFGISGVLPGTRSGDAKQQVFSFGGLNLVTILDHPQNGSITDTPWAKRAWTLQEHILSRRKIFTTNEQVYWQCLEACWVEEIALENVTPLEFSRHIIGPAYSLNLTHEPSFHRYATTVAEYMSRKLSFRSDTMNAFSGIMKAFEEADGSETFRKGFRWGLPIDSFNAALSWEMECSDRDHATFTIASEDGSSHKVPYPSWSWMAWFGTTISSPICWQEGVGYAAPVIQFYRADIGGNVLPILDGEHSVHVAGSPTIEQMSDDNGKYEKGAQPRNTWRLFPRTVRSCFETGEEYGIDSGKLKCWTSVAKLVVYRKSRGNERYVYSYGTFWYQKRLSYHIHVKINSHAGLDWQDPTAITIQSPTKRWQWPHWPREHPRNGPFQALTWRSPEEQGDIHPIRHVSFPLRQGDLQGTHNENEYKFSLDGETRYIVADFMIIGQSATTLQRLLRALVVKWRDGVAYRIGCAWIDELDWALNVENKEWKLVTLG